jgi:translation initiation factor IF-3
VRLIGADGKPIGVVNADDARRMADEAGLDLVEVSPNEDPPVCKVMDFGKFKYTQKKKERGGVKKSHSSLKELRVRPAIDKHDLEYRIVQGRRFLEDGHKVQVVCIFRGRQRASPDLGHKVMHRVAEALADIAKIESPPRMNGPRMNMMLARKGHGSSAADKPSVATSRAPRPARPSATAPRVAGAGSPAGGDAAAPSATAPVLPPEAASG